MLTGICEIAEEKIEILTQLWTELFEQNIGREHIKKLLDHTNAFFSDIIVETEERKVTILERIESLKEEKENLKRLLKEDINEVPDNEVPLHTLQMQIDESLKELREKLRRRHEQIQSFLSEQETLCVELSEAPRVLYSDPLPSQAEMNEFADHLERLRDLKFKRLEEIVEHREEIKRLMRKLEISVLDEHDDHLINSNNMKPTKSNIKKLKDVLELFQSQFNTMRFQIEDMRKRLGSLWKYLEVTVEQQKKFDKYQDITQTTYDKLHFEVERCEQIKKENIRVFIERVRAEIEEYWDKCLKSEAERLRFPQFNGNIFNEDVLELHEDELRDLKSFYENNEQIFKLIEERQDLWSQMEILQNKEQDPKRYANRGGQLLKEEKERKMITIKLPKIELKLVELADLFEQEYKRPFTIHGVSIKDVIEQDYDKKRQEKIIKSNKKVPQTPGRTPARGNMTTMRTPLTVEQTFANRTNVKTTGSRLRLPQSHKSILSTTASSTASSVRSVRTENGKRRVVQQPVSAPPAKRKLLGAFASPAPPRNVLKPLTGNTAGEGGSGTSMRRPATKNASLKVYNVGSVIKRRSKSRKSIGKKRKSSLLKKRPIPDIVIAIGSSAESEAETNTTSYEGFEVRNCFLLVN